jgi:hypothetical protein
MFRSVDWQLPTCRDTTRWAASQNVNLLPINGAENWPTFDDGTDKLSPETSVSTNQRFRTHHKNQENLHRGESLNSSAVLKYFIITIFIFIIIIIITTTIIIINPTTMFVTQTRVSLCCRKITNNELERKRS